MTSHTVDFFFSNGVFQCTDYIGAPICYWSDWVNDYDEAFDYQCDTNHFLSGVNSIHDSHHEDRM